MVRLVTPWNRSVGKNMVRLVTHLIRSIGKNIVRLVTPWNNLHFKTFKWSQRPTYNKYYAFGSLLKIIQTHKADSSAIKWHDV